MFWITSRDVKILTILLFLLDDYAGNDDMHYIHERTISWDITYVIAKFTNIIIEKDLQIVSLMNKIIVEA